MRKGEGRHLDVAIDDVPGVQVLQGRDDLSAVETSAILRENALTGEVEKELREQGAMGTGGGWRDGRTDGQGDGGTDGQTGGWREGWTDGGMDGQGDGGDGGMDRWTGGWTEGGMDRGMEGWRGWGVRGG